MDRASIIAIEEVCKRCHLYTKHCGMLECPSQCVHSGHFIDGYRKAEKDHVLTWGDVQLIDTFILELAREEESGVDWGDSEKFYEEVLRRFREMKNK